MLVKCLINFDLLRFCFQLHCKVSVMFCVIYAGAPNCLWLYEPQHTLCITMSFMMQYSNERKPNKRRGKFITSLYTCECCVYLILFILLMDFSICQLLSFCFLPIHTHKHGRTYNYNDDYNGKYLVFMFPYLCLCLHSNVIDICRLVGWLIGSSRRWFQLLFVLLENER